VPALPVNLVVACSDQKSVRPPAALQLRRYRALELSERVRAWVAALESAGAPATKAADLYVGDHWQVAKGLRDRPPAGVSPQLWVCSAGYGLVDADCEMLPYSATFATGHADSVATGREEDSAITVTQAWWAGLTKERRRARRRGGPRLLAELADQYPAIPLLVVGSAAYVGAVANDLLAAAGRLRSPELLSVFSTGVERLRGVKHLLVSYDARLQAPNPKSGQSYLGGAYPSLNARAAREALTVAAETRLRRPKLQAYFANLMESQPPLPQYDRVRAEPAQVEAFIRRELARNPKARHTLLLRAFRNSGNAFEYGRFKKVFEQVKEQTNREQQTA
jgi:hypothetical protein